MYANLNTELFNTQGLTDNNLHNVFLNQVYNKDIELNVNTTFEIPKVVTGNNAPITVTCPYKYANYCEDILNDMCPGFVFFLFFFFCFSFFCFCFVCVLLCSFFAQIRNLWYIENKKNKRNETRVKYVCVC